MRLRTHHAVKIIMSKFEVLMAAKTHHEIAILDKYMDEAQRHNLKQNDWMFWVFNVPSIFITLLRIGVYLFVGY